MTAERVAIASFCRSARACLFVISCLVFACDVKVSSPPIEYPDSLKGSEAAFFAIDGVQYYYTVSYALPRRFGAEEYVIFVKGRGISEASLRNGTFAVNRGVMLPVKLKYMTLFMFDGRLTKVAELPSNLHPRQDDEPSDEYYRRCIKVLMENDNREKVEN